jgi:hypothetical protein
LNRYFIRADRQVLQSNTFETYSDITGHVKQALDPAITRWYLLLSLIMSSCWFLWVEQSQSPSLGIVWAHLADSPHHLGSAGKTGSQAVQDCDVLQQLLVGLTVLTVVPE